MYSWGSGIKNASYGYDFALFYHFIRGPTYQQSAPFEHRTSVWVDFDGQTSRDDRVQIFEHASPSLGAGRHFSWIIPLKTVMKVKVSLKTDRKLQVSATYL